MIQVSRQDKGNYVVFFKLRANIGLVSKHAYEIIKSKRLIVLVFIIWRNWKPHSSKLAQMTKLVNIRLVGPVWCMWRSYQVFLLPNKYVRRKMRVNYPTRWMSMRRQWDKIESSIYIVLITLSGLTYPNKKWLWVSDESIQIDIFTH